VVVFTVSERMRRRLLLLVSLGLLLLLVRLGTWGMEGAFTAGQLHPVRWVDIDAKKLALTFDISWGEKTLPGVLEALDAHDVDCTFFVSGTWSMTHPELLRQIVQAGHEIGSHGHKHIRLSQYPRDVIEDNISTAHDIIKDITGRDPNLFRPPDGDFNDLVIRTAMELGYTTIIWDTDSLDWKNPGVDFMVKRVLKKAHPGDIVLLHASDSAKQTPEALPLIIEGLRERGYDLVTISELFQEEHD